MTDPAAIKAALETELAAAVQHYGPRPVPPGSPAFVRMSLHDAQTLVVNPDAQAGLGGRLARVLGGAAFAVAVDDTGATITRAE